MVRSDFGRACARNDGYGEERKGVDGEELEDAEGEGG